MGSLFAPQKLPPTAMPKPEVPAIPEVEEAEEIKKMMKKRAGRATTIKAGLLEPVDIGKRYLLA